MERTEKHRVVDDLKTRLGKAQSLVLADYRGLTVAQVTELRREFRKAGAWYKVVKNTLIEKAIVGTPFAGIGPLLKGMTAIAIGFEEPAVPAKVATKVARDFDKFKIKGGFFEGTVLDLEGVKRLSQLPGKDEARALFLAVVQAPAQQIVSVLVAPARDLLLVLDARAKQLEETPPAA